MWMGGSPALVIAWAAPSSPGCGGVFTSPTPMARPMNWVKRRRVTGPRKGPLWQDKPTWLVKRKPRWLDRRWKMPREITKLGYAPIPVGTASPVKSQEFVYFESEADEPRATIS